jgi:hypothetical protein
MSAPVPIARERLESARRWERRLVDRSGIPG